MKPNEQRRPVDAILLVAIVALAALGLVIVYSASAMFAEKNYGTAAYFLRRHAMWMGLGLVTLWIGATTDFTFWRKLAVPLLFVALLLLGLCLVPGIGARMGGARRWLRLPGVTFQPSELAKFALVTYLATVLARRVAPDGLRQGEGVGFRAVGLPIPLLVTAAFVGLVLVEPDLGTAVLLAATAVVMFFAAGAKTGYLVLAVLAAAPVVYQKFIVETPWRLKRVLAFLDPWAYRRDVGYQISESLISVGSGGVWGMGLGQGKQKLFFLPEAHTDFVLAIVGEELGLLGISLVVLCFAVILWRGTRAAFRARDVFGSYLAFGLTASLLLGALGHMGVVLGLLPTKGTTLPLVSYGGSALCITMLACGVLLNVSTVNPEPVQARVERSAQLKNRRVVPRSVPT